MMLYRVDVWGVKDGFRYEVTDGNGSVMYSGWARDEAAARRMARLWIDAQQPPGTPTRPPSTGRG